ncbi:MAG: ribosome maturation factor RimP [Actinomycetota bacterium]|nr:ribosome maturation factor RimP [Actinomycetota bacterium]MDH5314556.1 ribosome maturation factor RimP [Actinomycetota bacterium]
MDVEALLRPMLEAEGLELYDVTRGREHGRMVLKIEVEGPDGVDIDTLSRLSGRIAARLDDEAYETGPYDLEVSSPGLERSLRRPAHFLRTVGEQVKVKTTAPVAGSKTHTGTLIAADDEHVIVAVGDEPRTLRLADIASARTVVDWGAELKGSNA